LDAGIHFDGEEDFGYFAKDLVDLPDPSLVFEVNAGVKVRDLVGDGPPTQQLGLALVRDLSRLQYLGRRAFFASLEAAAAASPSGAPTPASSSSSSEGRAPTSPSAATEPSRR
jgi:hypothetical protein